MRPHAYLQASRGRLGPPGRIVLLLAALASVLAAPLLAQSTLGTLRGTVTDPQGAPIANAAVLITDENTGVPRAVGTDEEGRFEASNLRAGTYRVEVTTPQFAKFEQGAALKRPTPVEDVADGVLFAITNESLTGQTIVVDSGLHFH